MAQPAPLPGPVAYDAQVHPSPSRRSSCVLGISAVVALASRLIWEETKPLHFYQVKTLVYMRDAISLGPAALLGFAAVALWPSRSDETARGLAWFEERAGKIVSFLAVVTVIGCYVIGRFVLLGVPHVVDEAAYLWQSQLLAHGHVTAPIPAAASQTGMEYVGDVNGHRISTFFPGSALPLAVGQLLHGVGLVDPLLAGALVIVTYWAGCRLFDRRVALCAAALFAGSPFLLFQGASYFGQIWTALLIVPAFVLAVRPRRWWDPALVGALGAAALLSRPISALILAVFVVAYWIGTAISRRNAGESGDSDSNHRHFVIEGLQGLAVLGAAPFVVLFLAYDKVTTGDWWQNPHRLLLPSEKPLFGVHAIKNALLNVAGFAVDATGLVLVALILLCLAAHRSGPTGEQRRAARLILAFGVLQLGVYALYYNNGISYGPRYLMEATPLLVLAAAYALVNTRVSAGKVPAFVALALIVSLAGMLPGRISIFHERATYLDLAPVEEALSGKQAFVVMIDGPYEFPDPFYPAFVKNGISPNSNPIVYLRVNDQMLCPTQEPGRKREVYVLSMRNKARNEPVDRYLARSDFCSGPSPAA